MSGFATVLGVAFALATSLLLVGCKVEGMPFVAESGGTLTVFDSTKDAFSLPAPPLSPEHKRRFFVGNSFFNQNWVSAPSTVTSRDGLGPLFNARSCSTCHFKDGRGRPPEPNQPLTSMLLRISAPNLRGPSGEPQGDPVYGDQLQTEAVSGAEPEAEVSIEYEELRGAYADGERFSLRRPRYRLHGFRYGEPVKGLLLSPRVAPAMPGLGLLDAVPERVLEALSDPNDRDGDGISGRPNRVRDAARGTLAVGRFGWKAEQPSLRQQIAAAFLGDMGLTTTLFPRPNHTDYQTVPRALPHGGDPEVGEDVLDAVVLYARTLAVPARRQLGEAHVARGEVLFEKAGCAKCHVPTLAVDALSGLPEIPSQEIHPYTDLLLHDLGAELSDERPSFSAEGREWRTPPLWGIGLVQRVNGHSLFLHDGRARSLAEAVLWHAGEASSAREEFRRMSRADRAALLAFLTSL